MFTKQYNRAISHPHDSTHKLKFGLPQRKRDETHHQRVENLHLAPLSTTSSSTSIATVSSAATSSTTTSDSDEAVLLRDWDFERFFPPTANRNSVDPALLQSSSSRLTAMDMKLPNTIGKLNASPFTHKFKLEDRVKSEIYANNAHANHTFMNNLRASNAAPSTTTTTLMASKNICVDNTAKGLQQQQQVNHKRQEADSKLSMNFVRGFRRENSDFFPLSKRHSAVLGGERKPVAQPALQPQRSSGIFQRNKVVKGEPVLTEFVVRGREFGGGEAPTTTQHKLVAQLQATGVGAPTMASTTANESAPATSSGRSFDFLRPRREKTESVILIRNTAARQHLLDNMFAQQQVNTYSTMRIHLLTTSASQSPNSPNPRNKIQNSAATKYACPNCLRYIYGSAIIRITRAEPKMHICAVLTIYMSHHMRIRLITYTPKRMYSPRERSSFADFVFVYSPVCQ